MHAGFLKKLIHFLSLGEMSREFSIHRFGNDDGAGFEGLG